jgi:Fic family protein
MDIKSFVAGVYRQQYQYKSFFPTPIHQPWTISESQLMMALSRADIKLGELNAFSQLIPNVDFFIAMHVSKEATTSSRIEGTQTNIDDVIQKIEYIDPEKRDDWEEVQNYIKAMNEAITALSTLPLSSRLLKSTHHTLLQGVRGRHKLPGEFRRSQNWIGGASLADAHFIPPHHTEIEALIADLEHFLNDENAQVPALIKIGIAHYQFETIHPFLDGNGRIGRLLITLYLVSQGLLVKPTLYLSDFFEKHKMLYYDNLTRVRTHNDLTQWLKFFLEGVRQTSESSIATFKAIIAIRQRCEEQIATLGKRAPTARALLQCLYRKPITDGHDVIAALGVSQATAFRLLDDFVRLEILKENTGNKRNRIFVFAEYLRLFE